MANIVIACINRALCRLFFPCRGQAFLSCEPSGMGKRLFFLRQSSAASSPRGSRRFPADSRFNLPSVLFRRIFVPFLDDAGMARGRCRHGLWTMQAWSVDEASMLRRRCKHAPKTLQARFSRPFCPLFLPIFPFFPSFPSFPLSRARVNIIRCAFLSPSFLPFKNLP